MSTRTAAAAIAAVVFVFGTAACNSDRAYAPPDTVLTDQQVSKDVAVSGGEAMATDLASLANSASLIGGSFSVQSEPTSLRFDVQSTADSCVYGSGRWTCAPRTEGGLTVSRSYAFYDAAGQPTKMKDALTTASINFQLEINGVVNRDTVFSGVVHRTRNVTISGLLGVETTRRWDGVGISADTNTHRTALTTRTYAGKSVDSLKAIIYPQPRTPTGYPLSGSMVRIVKYLVTSTGHGTERRTVDRRIVVTYNGTSSAQVQAGSVTCTLHLDTHHVDGCS
ncbi:MAG: hypothetical protein M3Z17_06330 [Gemmatimonadota bacterium]|nr:hypothetical protein [Gemmatimonadota bacterium]